MLHPEFPRKHPRSPKTRDTSLDIHCRTKRTSARTHSSAWLPVREARFDSQQSRSLPQLAAIAPSVSTLPRYIGNRERARDWPDPRGKAHATNPGGLACFSQVTLPQLAPLFETMQGEALIVLLEHVPAIAQRLPCAAADAAVLPLLCRSCDSSDARVQVRRPSPPLPHHPTNGLIPPLPASATSGRMGSFQDAYGERCFSSNTDFVVLTPHHSMWLVSRLRPSMPLLTYSRRCQRKSFCNKEERG